MPHAVAHSFPPALAALFFSGARRRKNNRRAPTPTRVPGRETCLSRLNVVNTEFQLRHLIIWSSIFIHATSESGETRAHETGLRNERRNGARAYAPAARMARPTGSVFDPSSTRLSQRRDALSSFRFTSEQRFGLCGGKEEKRRANGRQKIVRRPKSRRRRRGDDRVDREKKKSVGGWRTSS